MEEKDHEREARLLVQAVLQEKASMHRSVNDAEKEYFERNPQTNSPDIPKLEELKPTEQFPPFLILMQETERIEQKFGKTLFILVVEECYNTKEEMSLPEHQWTNYTKKRYETLVKKVAELLKECKIKPLPK